MIADHLMRLRSDQLSIALPQIEYISQVAHNLLFLPSTHVKVMTLSPKYVKIRGIHKELLEAKQKENLYDYRYTKHEAET